MEMQLKLEISLKMENDSQQQHNNNKSKRLVYRSRRTRRADDSNAPSVTTQEPESDSDYPDDNGGLDLLTVSQLLQLDRPQPVRVIGLVDVIRIRFDLVNK